MDGFQNSAVENTILNLLAASENNYDYPALQNDAVDVIASNFSDVIYTTLKQKSVTSSTKRCNLLKFLNNICKTPEFHLAEDHYKIYLKEYEQEFCKTNYPEVEELAYIIAKEIREISVDVHSNVLDFYKRKNAKRRDKIKKQEFIKEMDQEGLSFSLGIQMSKNVSHYETNESLINDLLKDEKRSNKGNCSTLVSVRPNSRDSREKQVQFCYALFNIGNDESGLKILKSILHRFSTYILLEQFEIKFLMDLWLTGDHLHLDVSKIFAEKFPFLIEKLVIQFCTDIIKLKEASEVSNYFCDLNTNPKMIKVRDICTKNRGFYCKLKNLIYELYVFSYCNENVYRFSNCII